MMKIIEKNTKVIGYGKDIIFIDGKYYLVSESPAKICVSENLEVWEEYLLNESYLKPNNIAYGNGMFIVTGNAGTTNNTYLYYSKDGKTWVPKIIDTGQSFSMHSNTCKFINNKFIFTTSYRTTSAQEQISSTKQFYETTNITNIIRHDFQLDGSENTAPMDVSYHNGLYVVVGEHGSIFTSNDLIQWVRRTTETTLKLVGISWGKGKFVVTGDDGIILTSSDGMNWMKQDSGSTSYLIRSRYANGNYIAVGYNGTILQSIDAISWQNISSKHSGVRYGLAYNNIDNRFVITGNTYSTSKTIPIFYFDTSRFLSIEEENSELFFFDKSLNMLGIIDYFLSLRWRRKYFEAGEFEIVLPVTKYLMKFLTTDVLIMRNSYTEAGIIETIEFSDDGYNEEVTISGRFLSCLLERRIIKKRINFTGNTIEGMNMLIDSMTPLTPFWETQVVSMSSKSISFQVTYKNVYNYLCRLSEYSNIGFRIVPNVDSKVYMFEVYKGLDRTSNQNLNEQYSFSDDNCNIERGSLIISNKTKVNDILVGGVGEDNERIIVEVGKGAIDFDLHEVFVDQKSLSNSEVSVDVYKQMLKDIATSKLSEGTFKLEVNATSMIDYNKKWNIGDIVNVKKEKWGLSTSYRIIEIEEVIEDGKRTIYPSFGSPLASSWVDK